MDISFNHLNEADRLVVTTNTSQVLWQMADRAIIAAIVERLKGYTAGWEVPEAGVPVANTRFNFYKGDKLLGNVGVGRTFLTALFRGGFVSRRSTIELHAELLEMARPGLSRSDD
jgi:hypothetical protein